MKRTLLYVSILGFVGMLGVSWLTHGTGVVRNDIARNIYVPDELTMPLQVKAAYNGREMFFRYRWPTRQPSIYHDMMRFEGGKWVRYGASVAGPQPQGIYEDRVTMFVDDGSVPEFGKYGGYVTVGDRMRFFTNEATAEEVRAHPYLGQKRRQTEVGKHLPATRRDIGDWASVVPEDELAALRKAGYFLDLWHWRAHRSNPIGASDDQVVFDARYGDAGKGPFGDNWDAEKRQPKFMLDAQKTGRRALNWQDLSDRKLGFDDVYFISEETAAPFDASYAWKEGDTIPRRLLQKGSGSHADISVLGKARWQDGFWDVTLKRAMDTGNPADDKIMADKQVYNVAFAVHRNSYGSRWHYVSLPVTLGLRREAEMAAVTFEGDTPKWDQPWFEVTLFYPGQVSWPLLNSHRHAGADSVKKGVPVKYRHSEIQLAHYGVEMEFAEAIRRQWLLTLLAGVLLIVGFGVALNGLLARKGD
ncbi:MAG TPA: ethylbenzene dehydrogenase-related protein [Alphaproteobacteria bacterium]|nr:ethylbenzene dehydrogenase-related protein [Alphaproteobacteria bacterium]